MDISLNPDSGEFSAILYANYQCQPGIVNRKKSNRILIKLNRTLFMARLHLSVIDFGNRIQENIPKMRAIECNRTVIELTCLIVFHFWSQ